MFPINHQEGQGKIRSYQPQVTMQLGISQYTSHVLNLQDSFLVYLQNISLFTSKVFKSHLSSPLFVAAFRSLSLSCAPLSHGSEPEVTDLEEAQVLFSPPGQMIQKLKPGPLCCSGSRSISMESQTHVMATRLTYSH